MSTEDTQSPENCSDSGEEIEDETNEMEVSDTECTADCCHLTQDKPNQPVEMLVLAKTKRYQGSGKGRQARYVQTGWFKKHRWLSLCTTRNILFCSVCVKAVQRNLLTFSKNIEPSFTVKGFCNWRKAGECMKQV